MKWLPMKKLQTIADRMGLSGVSVHNFVVIKKLDGGKFMYLNFRVSCDDATQCFIHSLNGTRIVLDHRVAQRNRHAQLAKPISRAYR